MEGLYFDIDPTKLRNKMIVNCNYVYITDDNLPNPYDTLPTYIDIEVETIKIY